MKIYEELQARGLLAQLTDADEIRDLINNGKATFYIGFDPTADSLHVGHFMALCLMKRLQIEEPEEVPTEETTSEDLQESAENQEEIDGDYAELINEIGVLPEVGHNIADDLFVGVIILAIALIIYVKYKVK